MADLNLEQPSEKTLSGMELKALMLDTSGELR